MQPEVPVNKIKKLLALSRSSNISEAANALAKAMKLANDHNVEIKDLAANDSLIEEKDLGKKRCSLPKWECRLAAGMAQLFGCRIVTSKAWRDEQIKIVGIPEDIENCTYVYVYLLRFIRDLGNARRREWGHIKTSYYYGAVASVIYQAEKVFKTEATAAENESFALVLKRGAMVDKYLSGMKAVRRATSYIAKDYYIAGIKDAMNIPMHRGIGQPEKPLQAQLTGV